jgi:hypothetical protein
MVQLPFAASWTSAMGTEAYSTREAHMTPSDPTPARARRRALLANKLAALELLAKHCGLIAGSPAESRPPQVPAFVFAGTRLV